MDDSDEVRASAAWHYSGTRDSSIPLMLIQMRPHGMVGPGPAAAQLTRALMAQLAAAGWESPVLMFRGGHGASAGRVDVAGATGVGDVQVTSGGQVLYGGPLDRPPGWADMVRQTGTVAVLLGADPSLDDPRVRDDIPGCAEKGLLLAAVGALSD